MSRFDWLMHSFGRQMSHARSWRAIIFKKKHSNGMILVAVVVAVLNDPQATTQTIKVALEWVVLSSCTFVGVAFGSPSDVSKLCVLFIHIPEYTTPADCRLLILVRSKPTTSCRTSCRRTEIFKLFEIQRVGLPPFQNMNKFKIDQTNIPDELLLLLSHPVLVLDGCCCCCFSLSWKSHSPSI